MLTLKMLVAGAIKSRRGVTALEYAVIAGVVGIGLVAAFTTFYADVSTALQGAI
jgi:Flp pilus assembly pilin Flp